MEPLFFGQAFVSRSNVRKLCICGTSLTLFRLVTNEDLLWGFLLWGVLCLPTHGFAGQPRTTVASTLAETLHTHAPVPASAHAHVTAAVSATGPAALHIYAAPQMQMPVEVVQQVAPTMVQQAPSTVVHQLAPTVVQEAAPTVVQQAAPTAVQQATPVAVAAPVLLAAVPLPAVVQQVAQPLPQAAQLLPQAVEVAATAPQALMVAAPPQAHVPQVVVVPTLSFPVAHAQSLPPQAQPPSQVETMRVVEAPGVSSGAALASAATCSVCGNTFMDDSNVCRKRGNSCGADGAGVATLENAAVAPA